MPTRMLSSTPPLVTPAQRPVQSPVQSPAQSPSASRRQWLVGLACTASVPLLAACGSRPAPPRLLDLGRTPVWPSAASLPRRVDIQVVSGSELMLSTAVMYRLDDRDPFNRRNYRDSRWAGPLSTLMGERLKQLSGRAVLAAGAESQAPVSIAVDLEDCVQRFSSATQSELTLRMGATTGRQRRLFEGTVSAGSDAEGGARAIAQLLDRLGVEMLTWAATSGSPAGKA